MRSNDRQIIDKEMAVKKYLLLVTLSVALAAAGCGGGSSGGSGAATAAKADPISDRNLAGTCAFGLTETANGKLLPDQASTVIVGIWNFDGKGKITGQAAANGPSSNGSFASVTGSYNLANTGTGTMTITEGARTYDLTFTVNEFLDVLEIIGTSGSDAVIGECSI